MAVTTYLPHTRSTLHRLFLMGFLGYGQIATLQSASADPEPTSGTNPVRIHNDNMHVMENDLSGEYVLDKDLELGRGSNIPPYKYQDFPDHFNGVLHGNGHKLKVNNGYAERHQKGSIFRNLENAIIYNITLGRYGNFVLPQFTGPSLGALAEHAVNSTIRAIHLDPGISILGTRGNQTIGGLFSESEGCTIDDITISGRIENQNTTLHENLLGIISGKDTGSKISRIKIEQGAHISGVGNTKVGIVGKGDNTQIDDVIYAASNSTGYGGKIGYAAGMATSGSQRNILATGQLMGDTSEAGLNGEAFDVDVKQVLVTALSKDSQRRKRAAETTEGPTSITATEEITTAAATEEITTATTLPTGAPSSIDNTGNGQLLYLSTPNAEGGRTADELKMRSTYDSWADFDDNWYMVEGKYPVPWRTLRSAETNLGLGCDQPHQSEYSCLPTCHYQNSAIQGTVEYLASDGSYLRALVRAPGGEGLSYQAWFNPDGSQAEGNFFYGCSTNHFGKLAYNGIVIDAMAPGAGDVWHIAYHEPEPPGAEGSRLYSYRLQNEDSSNSSGSAAEPIVDEPLQLTFRPVSISHDGDGSICLAGGKNAVIISPGSSGVPRLPDTANFSSPDYQKTLMDKNGSCYLFGSGRGFYDNDDERGILVAKYSVTANGGYESPIAFNSNTAGSILLYRKTENEPGATFLDSTIANNQIYLLLKKNSELLVRSLDKDGPQGGAYLETRYALDATVGARLLVASEDRLHTLLEVNGQLRWIQFALETGTILSELQAPLPEGTSLRKIQLDKLDADPEQWQVTVMGQNANNTPYWSSSLSFTDNVEPTTPIATSHSGTELANPGVAEAQKGSAITNTVTVLSAMLTLIVSTLLQ